jgi:hypothetical protein
MLQLCRLITNSTERLALIDYGDSALVSAKLRRYDKRL